MLHFVVNSERAEEVTQLPISNDPFRLSYVNFYIYFGIYYLIYSSCTRPSSLSFASFYL